MTDWVKGRAIVVDKPDIDTDQIIPARYLKVTAKTGLGDALFADWRAQPDFPLSRPGAAGATILVAGANFGCGSSREHAPWALADWGFRAIIAPSFADIFKQNAMKNALLPAAIDARVHARLVAWLAEAPDAQVAIDLAAQRVWLPDGDAAPFPIDAFAKRCLLEGIDELGYLLARLPEITAHERR